MGLGDKYHDMNRYIVVRQVRNIHRLLFQHLLFFAGLVVLAVNIVMAWCAKATPIVDVFGSLPPTQFHRFILQYI